MCQLSARLTSGTNSTNPVEAALSAVLLLAKLRLSNSQFRLQLQGGKSQWILRKQVNE